MRARHGGPADGAKPAPPPCFSAIWPLPRPLDSRTVITDPLFYLVAIPAVVSIGLSKGGFAGVGTIATPLMALVMSPLQAAAILLPVVICQDVISVWVYRRQWSAWNLKVLLGGAVIGIGVAWLLAAHVSDALVRLMVGVIGTAFVLYAWLGRMPAKPNRPSALSGIFWGGVSGFTSTLAHAGGPPFQVHMLPQRLDKFTLVGTNMIFFAAVNVLKIVPFFALGQLSPASLSTSLMLLPAAILSNLLGIWLVRRTPTVLFYKIAYLLVLLISLELIRSGVMAMLPP